jgi:hypothetical protein
MACSSLTGDDRRVKMVYLKVLSQQDIWQSSRPEEANNRLSSALNTNRSARSHRIKEICFVGKILGPD